MRVRGVGVLRRRVADVAAQDQQRRAVLDRDALAESSLERVEVLGYLAELHHVPVVALETRAHVVGVRELGRTVDRDVIVVVDVHELAEPEVTGE